MADFALNEEGEQVDVRSCMRRLDQEYFKKWFCYNYSVKYHEDMQCLDHALKEENEQME